MGITSRLQWHFINNNAMEYYNSFKAINVIMHTDYWIDDILLCAAMHQFPSKQHHILLHYTSSSNPQRVQQSRYPQHTLPFPLQCLDESIRIPKNIPIGQYQASTPMYHCCQ